ncbi:MAG: DUF1501 domain-containing protein [Planctomycetes bacterium]|nr:DUF1501 domain-containing protein [Planctomycetota bacterium]MCB9869781.1 DUF1501 domain-containing protein [Planctomycetota bacterium]
MLSIPGLPGATCDGFSRRELLRVGGAGMLGLGLGDILALEALAPAAPRGNGFGKARNVILVFLQGGPSHLDIWDPKPDAPSNIRGEFKPIRTAVPGVFVAETMPKLARVLDRATLIRSVSYTPVGLFNHTAAIYQMLTGYTPDKVSPSGQLEPPAANDFPTAGSQITKLQPSSGAMLPFVMLPRPLQESNIIGKGGTAGFYGPAYDPYFLFQDPNRDLDLGDLSLREGVDRPRMQRRARLLDQLNAAMPEIDKATQRTALSRYQARALDLVVSGRARQAFDLAQEPREVRDLYGRHTFGQSCLLARRLVEAGTRFVQVNWPAVANGNPRVDAFDTHAENFAPLRNLHCPKLDSGLSALLLDLDRRGMLDDTLVLAIGEFGRSPKMGVSTSGNSNSATGRDHWPYCYTALIAGGGVRRGTVYGASDATGSSPKESPVHPNELLATVYWAMGIDPKTVVYNHLNQPRDLIKSDPVLGLF